LRLDTQVPQPTGHETFRVRPEGGSLMVEAERGGEWLALYEVSTEPQLAIDYELANWFTATHPNSPFRRSLMVTRVTPEARHALLDNRYTVRTPGGEVQQRTLDAAELERALADIFTLPVAPDWRPVIEQAVLRAP
jgi:N-hydroxyarylamine O-acetyltransferase